jgi:hypothetical protein
MFMGKSPKSWRMLQLVCSGFIEQTPGFFLRLYNFWIMILVAAFCWRVDRIFVTPMPARPLLRAKILKPLRALPLHARRADLKSE